MIDDCFHVVLIDAASGETRLLARDECSMRPVWYPDGGRVAYLRLDHSVRTLWARSTAGGAPLRLGFHDGVTYEFAFDGHGRLLAVGGPSNEPRGIWYVDSDGQQPPHALVPSFDPPIAARWMSKPFQTTVRSADGLDIPIIVFPRTSGPKRGSAVVWVHYGPGADMAPRWYQEVEYLTLLGQTVVTVNYRGSSGNGKAFRDLGFDLAGQANDLIAAIRYARSLPDVDPDDVSVFLVCGATNFSYSALTKLDRPVRAIIDWHASVHGWQSAAPKLPFPPMLWVNGSLESAASSRHALASTLARRGFDVTFVEYPVGHGPYFAEHRAQSLVAAEKFLCRTTRWGCRD